MDEELEQLRILRIEEVCRLTGLGKSTIYAKIPDGTFPPQKCLGDHAVGWHAADIVAWLKDPQRRWPPPEAS